MNSRNETFSGARAVDVTTVADSITIDTQGSGPARVTLMPETPGDSDALDRIQRAEVRLSGGTVIVDVPGSSGGGMSVRGHGTVVSGRNVGIQGGHVSNTVVQTFSGTYVSGGDMNFHGGGVRVSGHGNTVSYVYGNHHSGPTYSGGGVFIGGGGGGGGVRVMISAPANTDLTARTQSGSITHRGTAGGARITTQSGDIRVDTITGRADLTSVSGDVRASELTGGGRVKSTSGDVAVRVPHGTPVDVTTVSGDITRIGAPHLIHARTTSGYIR